MKYLFALVCLLFAAQIAPAQNMVHNPGFEQLVQCPNVFSQLDIAHVAEWSTTTGGTSDFYNQCCTQLNPNYNVGVPTNFAGYQNAYDGVAYTGIYNYGSGNYREYMTGNLSPLTPGQTYAVSIRVSRAENANDASDGFGVFFYKDGIGAPTNITGPLAVNPQVDYFNYGIITDTTNWVTLTDTFYADSAYQNIVIGNFRNDANTQHVTITNPTPLGFYAYYYVDYVDVQPTNPIFIATTAATNVTCNGYNNGTASVTAYNGTPPYSFLWQPGNYTTAAVSGLAAGSYTCTITDANNSTISQTVFITEPPALSVTSSQRDACYNASTGRATVTPSGGTLPYTYTWIPNVAAGPTATNLATGIYTCVVTDLNGCSVSTTFVIGQLPQLTATTSQTNILCYGNNTGTATVNMVTGTPNYTYLWTPPPGTGPTVNGLAAGNHTCTVTDANTCTLTYVFNITQPPQLTSILSQTNISCNASGSATVNISGGTPSYTYSWAPTGGNAATATGLAAGGYTCTTTDANNCSRVDSFTIIQTTPLSATVTHTNNTCFGGNAGTATVSVSGGSLPYTYLWAPSGGNNATASGLSAGNYTCTVTDNDGCTLTQTVTVTQPISAISATSSQTNILCNGFSTGSASVNASGGTPAYTYSWLPMGGTNATANNLPAGNYTCTITDANGCTLPTAVTLTQPSAITAVTAQTDVTCNGAGNGIASVAVSGGVPAYTYSWAPTGGNTATANGLSPGTYTCTITDANNCSLQKTFTIIQPAVLTAVIAHTDVTCFGGSNGTATVMPSGGTPVYTYSWAPTGGNAATASNLLPGSYTCTITDAHGCTATQSATIVQPATAISVFASQSNLPCNGATSGVATVVVSGGLGPYSYSWSPAGGNGANANNLAAGTYTCTITDANACIYSQSFTLIEPPAIESTTSHADILCHGGNNGIATVLVSGGTPGYTYSWAPLGGNSANATGLAGGVYTCTITDHNNCTHTATVTINEATALTAVDSQVNEKCYGDNTGYARVSVSGGTPPYTYIWSPSGGNGNAASGLPAGVYTCAIADFNNCVSTKTFNITQPAQLSAHTSKTNVVCQNLDQGVAVALATGGTPPYSYLWSPVNSSDTIITGLGVGRDTCLITDSNGCKYAAAFNIVDTSQPFSYTVTDSALDCRTALLNAMPVQGSDLAVSYLWLFSDSSSAAGNPLSHTFPQAGAGNIQLVVVNAVGCHDTLGHSFNINYPMLADFSTDPALPLPNTPIHFNNASSPYATSFYWSFGDGSVSTEKDPFRSYNDSGLYHICMVASDTNDCIDTACKDILMDVEKAVGIPSAFSPNGDGENDVLYIRGYRLATVRLRIYNRWGNLIFETNSQARGWDGTFKGQPQIEEAYAYVLEATFTDGSTKQINGSVSLLR